MNMKTQKELNLWHNGANKERNFLAKEKHKKIKEARRLAHKNRMSK